MPSPLCPHTRAWRAREGPIRFEIATRGCFAATGWGIRPYVLYMRRERTTTRNLEEIPMIDWLIETVLALFGEELPSENDTIIYVSDP